MSTARRPPPPPEDEDPIEPGPQSLGDLVSEQGRLVTVEIQTVQFIRDNESEQKKAEQSLANLRLTIEEQVRNLAELHGFKNQVVNLPLYRTLRLQIFENRRNLGCLQLMMAARMKELAQAKKSLELIRRRLVVLAKLTRRGQVIQFHQYQA